MKTKMGWVEVFLMPIVVASVGIMGTYIIIGQQQKNAEMRAVADRQIKILDDTDVLYGTVKGSGINWTYWATRKRE